MKIALLGGGRVGAALGTAWAQRGHRIFFGVRDPGAADMQETLAACDGRAQAGTPAQAAEFAGVVAIALPWGAVKDVLGTLDLTGKIMIDCTNPPAGVHGAEVIAAMAPGAKVAKCFNTTGSKNMANPVYPEGPAAMFVCADDVEAKAVGTALSGDAGFDTYDLGPLANARLLEALAQIWIHLAYRGGLGPDFAFRLVRR